MSRDRLPNRRASEVFGFTHGSIEYTVTVSRYTDGRLAEVFLACTKSGSQSDLAARDAAIVCSVALQFGADEEAIRHALLRDANGAAASPLGAALDLLAEREAP
jgi:ribonucleoside-diphosphate reductase alpha chain